ncbi:TetR/AcrR family transcriptional regulator [Catenulispora rubra]|uniref:TetR/AcrR family transcriptional regulator n=1 Tax=Catenulispora rubra TaxID=280293 RepID=UPI001E53B3F4|nr:TetR/AcrR family transcriptional regulator [Catenulispora rubra]
MEATTGAARTRAGRPTPEEAARLTERLRRAAVDTFLEYGYDRTTMEAVAQAAGITKSTLYSRYPDKHTLFVAVSSWALTRQERDDRVAEPLPDDLADALTVIARAILARSVDPDIVRLSRMAIAEAPRFPDFAVSSQAVTWSPKIRMIIDLLRRHECDGTVAVDDVELAAEQFFAMVGALPAWLAAYGIYRTPEAEEAHLRHAVELFLNGVVVRTSGRPDTPPAAEDSRDSAALRKADAALAHRAEEFRRREETLREILADYFDAQEHGDEVETRAAADAAGSEHRARSAVRRLLEHGESPKAINGTIGISLAQIHEIKHEAVGGGRAPAQ